MQQKKLQYILDFRRRRTAENGDLLVDKLYIRGEQITLYRPFFL
jgi:hypothetical protein